MNLWHSLHDSYFLLLYQNTINFYYCSLYKREVIKKIKSKKKKVYWVLELPMLSLKFLRVLRLLIISLLCVGYNRALLHSLSVRVRWVMLKRKIEYTYKMPLSISNQKQKNKREVPFFSKITKWLKINSLPNQLLLPTLAWRVTQSWWVPQRRGHGMKLTGQVDGKTILA